MRAAESVIEVYADISCPFAYVGLTRLAERRREHGPSSPDVLVRAWPLELVNGAPLDPAMIAKKVRALREQVAPDLFAGFLPVALEVSVLPAMALEQVAYARSREVGERVGVALRRALFESGSSLSASLLDEIAAREGLIRPSEAEARLALEASWGEGETRDVIGSPHFFLGDRDFFCPSLVIEHVGEELVIHADPLVFDRFLDEACGFAARE